MATCNPPRARILRALQAELRRKKIPAYMEADDKKGIVVCDEGAFDGIGFQIRRSAEVEEAEVPEFQVVLAIENVTAVTTPLGCPQRRTASLVIRVEAPERDQWPSVLTEVDELPTDLEPQDAVEAALIVAAKAVQAFSDPENRDFGDDPDPILDITLEDADPREELGDLEDQAVSMEERYDLFYRDDPITG